MPHNPKVALGHGGAVEGYPAGLYVNRDANVGALVLANALGRERLESGAQALKALDLLSK